MNLIPSFARRRACLFTFLFLPVASCLVLPRVSAGADEPVPVLQIKAGEVSGKVSPMLHGLMTEEINFSYEGGLYGELIRNRAFKASTSEPLFWSAASPGKISLDPANPLNTALNTSLKLDATAASKDQPAGIVNQGYWGIPVRPKTTYHSSFFAKAADGFAGKLTVSLSSDDGQTNFATAEVSGIGKDWKKFDVTLKTRNVAPSKKNRFTITTTTPGAIWFQQVSLFPPTYKNRVNGNRPDLMQLLAEMKPKFLRFPGGNYLEGNIVENRFNWKNTLGDVSQRPGHDDDGWGYWSTDGLGLLEFLEWCEDLNMEPLLAVYAGYSMNQIHIPPGDQLKPFVQDALDEIEYATGGTDTKWGAKRARDGHPAPFLLHYVEIGNEDWFDKSWSYEGRFAQFYDAIKAAYPGLQLISTAGVSSRKADLNDEHYYRSLEDMQLHALDYDNYPRTNHTKIFCGEWATRVGSPTPNMAGALGDAAWMTGMERNSDIVLMHSYAPLFVNVSDLGRNGSMQWPSDLIGYDALASYGSPSYYAQKMFSTLQGDTILATASQNIPVRAWQPDARRKNGKEQSRQIREIFFDATRDAKSGKIFLKVVNCLPTAQPVKVEISGVASVRSKGKATVLKAASLDDTNSIEKPANIIPATEKVTGLGRDFTRTFPAYSITVLEIEAK